MREGSLLDIVTTCREIDTMAASAYKALAGEEEGELPSFWLTMSAEEEAHAAFWDRVISMVEMDFIPQLFPAPHNTTHELEELRDRSQKILEQSRMGPDLPAAFLLAYRMEFYLLHPAFEVLFQYMCTISDEPNPMDQYESRIARFVQACQRHGEESPELNLVGETLSRLWLENRRLSHQTMHDELTGLLNRRGFMNAVKPMFHLFQRNRLMAGLIMVDVDNFKAVNDRHGHQIGDAVLCEVARQLRQTIREADLVGRYGGEEFILFFSSRDRSGAVVVAEKLRQAVAGSEVKGVSVTISLGVACVHPGRDVGEDLADLFADADAALLRAKSDGKNRCEMAPE